MSSALHLFLAGGYVIVQAHIQQLYLVQNELSLSA